MGRLLAAVMLVGALAACSSPSPKVAVTASTQAVGPLTAKRPTTTTTAPNVAAQLVLPNRAVTPGAVSTFTQAQICAGHYPTRPPQQVTTALKQRQIAQPALGYAATVPWVGDKNLNHYEEDHLIPLELGGDPSSTLNLWPEPGPNIGTSSNTFLNNVKDALESKLHDQVCHAKAMTLAAAQQAIAADWISLWRSEGSPTPINVPPYYKG